MGLGSSGDSELRFAAYVEGLVRVIGHKDRAGPLRDYCTGGRRCRVSARVWSRWRRSRRQRG